MGTAASIEHHASFLDSWIQQRSRRFPLLLSASLSAISIIDRSPRQRVVRRERIASSPLPINKSISSPDYCLPRPVGRRSAIDSSLYLHLCSSSSQQRSAAASAASSILHPASPTHISSKACNRSGLSCQRMFECPARSAFN